MAAGVAQVPPIHMARNREVEEEVARTLMEIARMEAARQTRKHPRIPTAAAHTALRRHLRNRKAHEAEEAEAEAEADSSRETGGKADTARAP